VTHTEKVARWLAPLERAGGIGTEIGAFKTPLPGIHPVYVDRFAEYANEPCLADFFGDATALPFRDDSLAYVASSHVLEHVANPIAAFAEWYRVLRPGGIIYLVVPDRRYTFDHQRPLTTVAHLVDDFERGTTQSDATHIDDFVDGVDWSTYSPATPPREVPQKKDELKSVYRTAVASGNEINIHFHVFELATVLELVTYLRGYARTRFDWEIADRAETFPADRPDGALAVIRVKTRWLDRARHAARRLVHTPSRADVLRADAKPLTAAARR
jgi:SAM-dependent methyltransferase